MCRCVLSIPIKETWQTAAIGLGGNIGDPAAAMARALQGLNSRDDCRVLAVSRLYRTPPWGKTDQADFYNGCALVSTTQAPQRFLELCLSIERDMKRVRLERWGPRTIDIDVLTFGDLTLSTEGLEIPHPRMLQRGFVLMPLADIAAEQVVSGRTIREWLVESDVAGITVASETPDWWRATV